MWAPPHSSLATKWREVKRAKNPFVAEFWLFLVLIQTCLLKFQPDPQPTQGWDRGGAFKFPGFLENFVLNLGEIWEDIETG